LSGAGFGAGLGAGLGGDFDCVMAGCFFGAVVERTLVSMIFCKVVVVIPDFAMLIA